MIEGVDCSHHQGAIDFSKVAKADKHFAHLKATEGTSFVDEWFARNRDAAAAAGVHAGAYHFYRYAQPWDLQAHNFFTAVGAMREGEMPPVLDLEEDAFRNRTDGVKVADATRKVLAWLSAVKDHLGVTPVIYADRDFVARFLQDREYAQYPLWLAALTKKIPAAPNPWDRITLWQYNWAGKAPGVSGDCDLDRFNGDVKAFRTFLAKV